RWWRPASHDFATGHGASQGAGSEFVLHRAGVRDRGGGGAGGRVPARCARGDRGADDGRGAEPVFSFQQHRAAAAGPELPGRGDAAGDGRGEPNPRVLHAASGDGEGRRGDPHRQPQPDHGVQPHRARLPRRQPRDYGELLDAGGACDGGRPRHAGGGFADSSIRAGGAACLFGRRDDHDAGRAAVRDHQRDARQPRLWAEQDRPAAARIQRGADRGAGGSVPSAAELGAEHLAGGGEDPGRGLESGHASACGIHRSQRARRDQVTETYGLIAGNGRFPFLLLEAARGRGIPLIEVFHKAGVRRAVMAGQVKHKQIFSHLRPDWKMAMLLASLATRNTDSLLGAVAESLEKEGIHLESSTEVLQPLLAGAGTMTRRGPSPAERADLDYGFEVARHLSAMDIGQAVAIASRACIAAEAMEGTDAMIRRAASLAGGRGLTVVKVAKPKQDLRFDVPVVGPGTIRAMQAAGATALGVDAGITLMLEREALLAAADAAGIAIEGRPKPA